MNHSNVLFYYVLKNMNGKIYIYDMNIDNFKQKLSFGWTAEELPI